MPDCLLHGSCNPAGNWYKDVPRGIAVSAVKESNEEWQGGIGRHKMLWHEARDRYFLSQLLHTVETASGKAGVFQTEQEWCRGAVTLQKVKHYTGRYYTSNTPELSKKQSMHSHLKSVHFSKSSNSGKSWLSVVCQATEHKLLQISVLCVHLHVS